MLLEVGRAHWQSMAKRASPFPVSAEGLPLQFIEVGRTPSHCGALATCVHVHAGRAEGGDGGPSAPGCTAHTYPVDTQCIYFIWGNLSYFVWRKCFGLASSG